MRPHVGVLLVLLGVVLVANPLYLFEHAGETRYEYTTSEIEYTEGTTGYVRAPTALDGVDCYRAQSRECLFAEAIVQRGNGSLRLDVDHRAHYYTPADFVVVESAPNGEPFYRREANVTEGYGADRDNVTYSLEPVATETLLREVARNVSEVNEPMAELVRTGNLTLYDQTLQEGAVVTDDETYYVVTRQARESPDLSRDDAAFLHSAVAAFGLGLAVKGQRLRIE
jgi:hypothetical protein